MQFSWTPVQITMNIPKLVQRQYYCTGPQMIPDRKWPQIGPQMIPDRKWSPYWIADDPDQKIRNGMDCGIGWIGNWRTWIPIFLFKPSYNYNGSPAKFSAEFMEAAARKQQFYFLLDLSKSKTLRQVSVLFSKIVGKGFLLAKYEEIRNISFEN